MDLINKDIDQLIGELNQASTITVDSIWYRYHNPIWAWSPYAGTGAQLTGGRFNPKGIAALYLADSPETALMEVTAGTGPRLIQPWLLCSYRVRIEGILDLTQHQQLFNTPWRLQLLQGEQPPGWSLYNQLNKHTSISGLLVPSYQTGATNLVLFHYCQHEIQAYDPDQRLNRLFPNHLVVDEWG